MIVFWVANPVFRSESMQKNNLRKALIASYASIIANLFLALIKGTTGYWGNSFALIADAIESATDIFSSLLVMIGLRYSARPPDKNHPYGHGKIEPLTTFIVVGILLVSATFIAVKSIQNIRTPHETPEPYTLIVLGGIIIIKEFFYRFVNQVGKETKSTSLQADAWHHRSDAITSFIAFLGIGLALLLGTGYENADDWAALIAAGFIAYNAYHIFRPALGEVMDEHLHDDLIEDIRGIANEVQGIEDTEKCFVRKSGMFFHVDIHIIVNGDISVKEGHSLAHAFKDKIQLQIPEIVDVLVHVEPNN